MASRRLMLLIYCALVPLLSACSSTVRKPHLLHPGPAGYQRANAEEFDPYPLNDVGPEIVGGRPPDYQVPVDEVTRTRMQDPIGPWRTPSAVVPATVAPITAPIIAPIAPPVAAPIAMPAPVPTPMVRY